MPLPTCPRCGATLLAAAQQTCLGCGYQFDSAPALDTPEHADEPPSPAHSIIRPPVRQTSGPPPTPSLPPGIAAEHVWAQWVSIALAVGVGLDCLSMGSSFLQLALLSQADGGATISAPDWAMNDAREMWIGCLQGIEFLVTAILFLLWIHRAHQNLPLLGARNLKYSPAWAVGGFFVPLLNLIRPFQVIQEIWRASSPLEHTPDSTPDSSVPVPASFNAWWGAWVFYNLLSFQVFRASDPTTIPAAMRLTWQTIGLIALSIIAGLLAIAVVRRIDQRQAETARQIGLLPE